MITIKLLFFASLKERAGLKETTLELPDGAHVADLKTALKAHPKPRACDELHAGFNQSRVFSG